MSLGVIIDVALGLSFLYTLLALIASALQESVAAILKLRGSMLRKAIIDLLAGTSSSGPATAFAQAVFDHPLVQGTSRGLPSYLPARNFSAALFSQLCAGSQAPVITALQTGLSQLPSCPLKQSMTSLLVRSGGDLDKLTSSVEQWYDDAMDRVSGDYKRFTHYFALIFGLLVAIVLNVDTLTVARTLWTDPAIRSTAASIAVTYATKSPPPDPGEAKQISAAAAELDALHLPVGWTGTGQIYTQFWEKISTSDCLPGLLGWIVTALAVSLGSPFWFDTLQKLANLRAAGPPPARSDSQATS
jgi:hypothetical protein